MYKAKKYTLSEKIEIVNAYRKEACKKVLFRTQRPCIREICDKYHVSKATLMRWNAQFDGTEYSLKNKSCAPKTRVYNTEVRLEAVLLFRSGKYTRRQLSDIYGFSGNSLTKWNIRFDGTKESLMDR